MNHKIDAGCGFLLYRQGSGRSVELLDIEVKNGHRRKGIGRSLVEAFVKEAVAKYPATSMVFAITRWSNVAAQQFYESLGWRILGRLHNFYHEAADQSESAVVYGMEL